MKAKVVKRFKDKYTGEIYEKGKYINVTEERAEEILETAPLIIPVVEKESEEPKATEETKPKRAASGKKATA